MTFKKILVPVDFSAHASDALKIATDLALRNEARLTLVHVFQPMTYVLPQGYAVYSASQFAEMQRIFEKQLDALKKQAQEAGIAAVDTAQLQGVPASEIVQLAASDSYDLIVMGTHGRTGLKHALLGSVAENVVRRAPCPVLTVRARDVAT